MFKSNKEILDIAKANSYEDFVSTFDKSYFKRGIVKTNKMNDRLPKEILTNNNLQNYIIHYLTEKIYTEVNR